MKLVSRLLVSLVLTAVGTSSLAQQLTPPPAEPPKPFTLAETRTIELDNGLRATFVPFGSVPKVSISAILRTGAIHQGDRLWLSDLTTELMKEGTRVRSAGDIAEAAARMGGSLGAGSGDDETSFSLDVLSESAPDAIKLIAEVMTQPLLPESELPRLKQNFQRALSVQLSQPQAIADAAFSDLIYPEHPYGKVFPTEQQLDSYTITDVRSFYSTNFGARRTHVYIVGQFDEPALERAVRDAFGGWIEGPSAALNPPTAANRAELKLIDRPGAPQSTLRIGTRVIDPTAPDFMALSVANTLLGGILTSRITMNLREDKGWAYSPNSALATKYRSAAWYESADVQTASTGAALEEIHKEITRLSKEPPPASELEAIQKYRHGMFVLSNATRGGVLSQLAFMDFHGLPREWLTTWVERLYAVSPQQVQQATQEHLNLGEMSTVIVGDMSQVRPQIGTAASTAR